MTRAEWRRDVQKALIDKGSRISQMSRELGVTTSWIYQVLNGDIHTNVTKVWERKISDYCGIELKGDFDNENDED